MNALEVASDLVAIESVSTNSNVAATDRVESLLKRLGFATERIDFVDSNGVDKGNVVGKKGPGSGGVAYFAHTDVVPATNWSLAEHGPFSPTVKEGRLYGRGSCDMKGSIACMLAAAGAVPEGDLNEPIYITCTADEEVGYYGAREVAERSALFREMVAGDSRGVIGEPTRLEVVHGHKGMYGFRATARGRAAHSSTREGVNANLAMIPFLVEMKAIHDECESDPAWRNDLFDPPTISWNIGINDHTAAVNMTAPQSVCTVCYRPMPGQDGDALLQRVRATAELHGIELDRVTAGPPVFTDPGSEYVREALALAGGDRSRTVAYGTDGGMFSEMKNLVVLGPGDIAQAHTSDEWIALEQLDRGAAMFEKLIRHWCC